MPFPLTRSRLGFIPTTPFHALGVMSEPTVSVPMLAMARKVETDTAEPELDPPLGNSPNEFFVCPATALDPPIPQP